MDRKSTAAAAFGVVALLLIFWRYILVMLMIGMLIFTDNCGASNRFRSEGLIPANAAHVYARTQTGINSDGCGLLYYELPPDQMALESEWRPITQQARAHLESMLGTFEPPLYVQPDFSSPLLEFKGDDSSGCAFSLSFRDRRSGKVWYIEASC